MTEKPYKAIFDKRMTRKQFIVSCLTFAVSIFPIVEILKRLGEVSAASSVASVDATTGKLSGGASIVKNSGAIDGEAVEFAKSSTGSTSTSTSKTKTSTGGSTGTSGGGSTGTSSGTGTAKLQTIYDSFPGTTLNTSLWTDESQNETSGQITVSGGALRLKAASNFEVEVDSKSYYDTTKGLWAVKWSHTGTGTTNPGHGEAGTECYFGFADSSDHYLELQIWPASDFWYPWADGSGATVSNQQGNQDAFGSAWTGGNYIGIGDYNLNNDNRIHVYSSPDGVTWTEVASWEITGPINMSAVALFLGTYQITGSSNWVSVFEDASTFAKG